MAVYQEIVTLGLPSYYQIPLIVWSRLEGRPRHEEFSESLAMAVHDPLWMLTRQWQFGEFKAENRGSSLLARIAIESKRLTHVEDSNGFQSFPPAPDDMPLEVLVERLNPKLTILQRADIGKIIFKLADEAHGLGGGDQAEFKILKADIIQTYGFRLPSDPSQTNWSERMDDVRILSNEKSKRIIRSFIGRIPDGWAIYQDLIQSPASFDATLSQFMGDAANLKKAIIEWVESTYQIPSTTNWNKESLSYAQRIAFESDDTSDDYDILTADGYDSGKLDWYSFDREKDDNASITAGDSRNQESDVDIVTVIPTGASFTGMPNKRLWNLEDGKMDFAHLDIDSAEIVKQVLSEYALVYSNDWSIVPYSFPLNSVSRVKGMVVTDVFGENILLQSSTLNSPVMAGADDPSWTKWGFFMNDLQYNNEDITGANSTSHADMESILVAPTLAKSDSGPILEEVYFRRDEVDNRVYAIEERVFDIAQRSRKGDLISNDVNQFLADLLPLGLPEEYYADLAYRLGDELPENWIPFIPLQLNGDGRSIALQRASMPRFTVGGPVRIRPVSDVLRAGIDSANNQVEPYLLNEEVIPRTGIRIADRYQRARWHGGKTYLWLAREKRVKQYPLSSGLSFDNIDVIDPSQVVPYTAPAPYWGSTLGIGTMAIGVDFQID